MYFLIEREVDEIGEWPESIARNNYNFCEPQILEKCNAGDWVGFVDSELPAFSKGIHPQSSFDVRYVYCQPIGAPPSSQTYRIINMQNNDILYLCRLDLKDKILEKINKAIEPDKA